MTIMITELRSTAYSPDFGVNSLNHRESSGPLHSEPQRTSQSRPVQLVGDGGRSSSQNKKQEDRAEFEKANTQQAADHDNSSVSQLVRDLLNRSGYPLANIQCHCFDQSLELSGTVSQYYHLQVALEIAKQSAGGRQLDLQVQVTPQSTPIASSDPIQP